MRGLSTIVWTCDRCGVTETLPATEHPRWLGILFGVPPEGDPYGKMWVRKHLCPECDRAFAEFFPHHHPAP